MPATLVRSSSLLLSALAAVAGATVALAQTATATGPARAPTGLLVIDGPAPASMPSIAIPSIAVPTRPEPTASVPAPALTSAPAAAVADLPPVTQPFIATITGDKVYVRSGPSSTTYYEIGQLVKGDQVYVVGASKNWYQILPPNGAYCLIAKEFVDVDAGGGGGTGTVKADFVNVRAGSAIYKTRDQAILTIARKGAKLKIVGGGGPNDKYYEVAPPDHAFFYISPQFLKPTPAGVEYKVPDLQLPPGITGPAQRTVTAPTTLPSTFIEIPETRPAITPPSIATTTPASPTPVITPPSATEPTRVAAVEPVPVPVPSVTFSASATEKFNDLNARYQAEIKKPIAEQNVDGLLNEYKNLLTMENIAPSVKVGSETRIGQLEKTAVMQRLIKSAATNDEALAKEREAMQQQWAAQEKALADHLANSPYAFQGVLQTSNIVQGKYALVNPATGRTVAYVDPASDIDIGSLIGKYVGVRGSVDSPSGAEIKVIRVTTATLMAPPKE